MTTPQRYPATLPAEREQAIADILARLGHELRQAHIAAAEWQRQCEENEKGLQVERAAHEATRGELKEFQEGYKQVVGDVSAAQEKLGIAERMARYLGWAFEQKLIHPNETAELLGQVLREWKAGVSDASAWEKSE